MFSDVTTNKWSKRIEVCGIASVLGAFLGYICMAVLALYMVAVNSLALRWLLKDIFNVTSILGFMFIIFLACTVYVDRKKENKRDTKS